MRHTLNNLTPFEHAKLVVFQFSNGLHNDCMMQNILPLIDRLSFLYDEAIEGGDEESANYYKNTQDMLIATIPAINVD